MMDNRLGPRPRWGRDFQPVLAICIAPRPRVYPYGRRCRFTEYQLCGVAQFTVLFNRCERYSIPRSPAKARVWNDRIDQFPWTCYGRFRTVNVDGRLLRDDSGYVAGGYFTPLLWCRSRLLGGRSRPGNEPDSAERVRIIQRYGCTDGCTETRAPSLLLGGAGFMVIGLVRRKRMASGKR